MSTRSVMECYKRVMRCHGRRTWSYYSPLLDAATTELFSGEEHMRDEHGCSVSPSHIRLLDLWVKCFWVFVFVCFVFLGFFVCGFLLLFLLHTSPTDPFLHNYCKNTHSAN